MSCNGSMVWTLLRLDIHSRRLTFKMIMRRKAQWFSESQPSKDRGGVENLGYFNFSCLWEKTVENSWKLFIFGYQILIISLCKWVGIVIFTKSNLKFCQLFKFICYGKRQEKWRVLNLRCPKNCIHEFILESWMLISATSEVSHSF